MFDYALARRILRNDAILEWAGSDTAQT